MKKGSNNIIGVIGGMGPQASAEFYRILIDQARHTYGAKNNDEYPEIVMDSVPVPYFIGDTDRMEEAAQILESRVRRLAAFGATTITMACNTACILTDRLQKQTDVPFISVIDTVVKEVSRRDHQVLLLASPTSLRLGLYQLALARHNLPYIVPQDRDYRELEYIIRGVLAGEDRGVLMRKLVKIVSRYRKKEKVDGIVLGCTELPLVFPINYDLPVYNSLSILANTILKQYYTKPSEAHRSPSGTIPSPEAGRRTRLTERFLEDLRDTNLIQSEKCL